MTQTQPRIIVSLSVVDPISYKNAISIISNNSYLMRYDNFPSVSESIHSTIFLTIIAINAI